MLPDQRCLLQASISRLRTWNWTALAAVLTALASPAQALAQDVSPVDERAPRPAPDAALPELEAQEAPPAAADPNAPVAFEADRVEYRQNDDTVVATGNVLLKQNARSLRTDTVTWNRETGKIVATGNVRMVDEDGNQLYTESVELTEELKTGAMANMLLVLREGGRLAAVKGERLANGDAVLSHASYTACAVEDANGCPKKPTWRLTASQVVYDDDAKQVRFRNARIEIFGVSLLPLPGLTIKTDGGAQSGLLSPDLSSTPSNGLEISQSWYQRLGDDHDVTATAYLFTEAPPMVSAQYRALNSRGAYQITGYATASRRIPLIDGTGGTGTSGSQRDFRGYLLANGRLQFSPEWSVTASIRRATDRTFLRRYDISRDDRLRSMIDVERITPDSYLSIAGWATQTMRVSDKQGQVPLALPVIDYRRRLDDPVLGGKVELQLNSLGILRSSGQDTQRAFAGARWDLRRFTGMGQEVTLTALVRGDIYHSDENALTSTVIYRGNAGWQTRGVATAAIDVKWPFVGSFMGGTQVLTPRLQIVASPSIRNLAVPNEDARAIDLEDSNLFALNRFPGYDRIEDGVRFTYGFDWQFEAPRWRIKTTVGQSLRLTSEPTLLPDGTGISNRTSDIVGRTEVRYRDFIKLTHRFRLDKDSLGIRRNEFDATVGNHRTYAEVGYIRLNRDIAAGLEDLQDREELRVAGRVAFARYWSLFGSAVVNLTDRKEDPTNISDGFQPLRTRLGAAYQDDCLELGVTWRRDYVATGDARKGNTFLLHFALRNLGYR